MTSTIEVSTDMLDALRQMAEISPDSLQKVRICDDALSNERTAAERLQSELVEVRRLYADITDPTGSKVRPRVAAALIPAFQSQVVGLLGQMYRFQGCFDIPADGPLFRSLEIAD